MGQKLTYPDSYYVKPIEDYVILFYPQLKTENIDNLMIEIHPKIKIMLIYTSIQTDNLQLVLGSSVFTT